MAHTCGCCEDFGTPACTYFLEGRYADCRPCDNHSCFDDALFDDECIEYEEEENP